MTLETLSHQTTVETHAIAVTAIQEALPKDGVIYAPDPAINLPIQLNGARIEANMLKADRPVRVGATVSEKVRDEIIAAEDARLSEIRAAFTDAI